MIFIAKDYSKRLSSYVFFEVMIVEKLNPFQPKSKLFSEFCNNNSFSVPNTII